MTRKKFISMYTNLIQCSLRLNEKAIKYGISSLDNEVFDLDDDDLRTGLLFILEKADPAIIDEIFSNMIAFEKDKYMRQLITIKKRALLGIQKQESFRVLYYVLNSYADLSKNERRKIDLIILSDDSDDNESENDSKEPQEKIYAKYTFNNSRLWAMAMEDIENEFGKDKSGVNFGDASNTVMIVTMDCPDPYKVDKILENREGISLREYHELDLLELDN